MNKTVATMNEILKNTIRRTGCNGYSSGCANYDVYVSVSPATKKKSTIVRFNFRFKWVKNFNCVKLSRVGNNLYFIFSEIDKDGIAYAITRKEHNFSTSISGKNTDRLVDFKGFYKFKEYDWRKSKEPIFYISLEDKIDE